MQEPSQFAVSVETRIPPFESERRFVVAEKAVAQDRIAKLKEKPGVLTVLVARAAGEPRVKEWEHYIEDLDRYATKLDHHEAEVAGGLIPVKFFVLNTGDIPTKDIRIHIQVERGMIRRAKQQPRRPARVDEGPVHVPQTAPTPAAIPVMLSGFKRTGVKVSPHSIDATFSRLEADDSADVVHQVLYVEATEDTHFTYEVQAQGMAGPQRGEVEVV